MTTTAPPPASTFGSLSGVRESRERVRAAEVEEARQVLAYALSRPPVDDADVACHRLRPGEFSGVERVDLNAACIPTVSAVAVAELGVALGVSTESARAYVAQVLELAYRLPGVWQRLQGGGVPVWVARRVARSTIALSDAAAGFVDEGVAAVVGRISLRRVELLVVEAVARREPERVIEQAAREAEQRGLVVQLDRVTITGLVPVCGQVDLVDALALDAALNHGAAELQRLGSTESVDARRARAVGDLAREHLNLWEQASPDGPVIEAGTIVPIEQTPGVDRRESDPGPRAGGAGTTSIDGLDGPKTALEHAQGRARAGASRRRLVLHVHLSAAALRPPSRSPDTADATAGDDALLSAQPGLLGRVEDPHLPITADTVRAWCGQPNTAVTVLPVLDLAEQLHHSAYEIPARVREHVIARDVSCVFPFCDRAARTCDLDHVVPFDHDDPTRGGQTSTQNLAPLCRHHHRLKTTGRIRYRSPSPGVYEWTFPDGTGAHRDHNGSVTLPAHLVDAPARASTDQPTRHHAGADLNPPGDRPLPP